MNARREPAFQAGMPHTRAVIEPRTLSRQRMNTLDVGSVITLSPQRGCGALPGELRCRAGVRLMPARR
jgi:hypothetical protein